MTLVDSNILIDVFGKDPLWWNWSLEQLELALGRGPVLVNDVVYAETSIRFRNIQIFDAALVQTGVTVSAIPRPALFLAGKAYEKYRNAGGIRTGVLPDFFIGAHAEVEGLSLLTRDAQRYRRYFPSVSLITPNIAS